jgi:hypothetical protein
MSFSLSIRKKNGNSDMRQISLIPNLCSQSSCLWDCWGHVLCSFRDFCLQEKHETDKRRNALQQTWRGITRREGYRFHLYPHIKTFSNTNKVKNLRYGLRKLLPVGFCRLKGKRTTFCSLSNKLALGFFQPQETQERTNLEGAQLKVDMASPGGHHRFAGRAPESIRD